MYYDFNSHKILLASNSPRRRELLKFIAPNFQIAPPVDTEETYPSTLKPDVVPAYLSKLKAAPYLTNLADDEILITADTVVICDDKILGKPKDNADAFNMLRLLSGKTHKVITGVSISAKNSQSTFSATTFVTFDQLNDDEINYYIDTYHPLDKAGAYGIQEWIGGIGITKIEGCYYNVVGLPLNELKRHLIEFQRAIK